MKEIYCPKCGKRWDKVEDYVQRLKPHSDKHMTVVVCCYGFAVTVEWGTWWENGTTERRIQNISIKEF